MDVHAHLHTCMPKYMCVCGGVMVQITSCLHDISMCRIVGYEQLYKPDYLTISQKGVTRMRSDDDTEFITLERWEQEIKYFEELISVSLNVRMPINHSL